MREAFDGTRSTQTISGLVDQRDVDTVSRYECVDAREVAGFAVPAAREAAEVSTSGFCDWVTRTAGPTARHVRVSRVGGVDV